MDRHVVIALPLPCAPCFARRCPLGHHACMREVSAKEVFERASELLWVGAPREQRASPQRDGP